MTVTAVRTIVTELWTHNSTDLRRPGRRRASAWCLLGKAAMFCGCLWTAPTWAQVSEERFDLRGEPITVSAKLEAHHQLPNLRVFSEDRKSLGPTGLLRRASSAAPGSQKPERIIPACRATRCGRIFRPLTVRVRLPLQQPLPKSARQPVPGAMSVVSLPTWWIEMRPLRLP
jgi:hypothetical protein